MKNKNKGVETSTIKEQCRRGLIQVLIMIFMFAIASTVVIGVWLYQDSKLFTEPEEFESFCMYSIDSGITLKVAEFEDGTDGYVLSHIKENTLVKFELKDMDTTEVIYSTVLKENERGVKKGLVRKPYEVIITVATPDSDVWQTTYTYEHETQLLLPVYKD